MIRKSVPVWSSEGVLTPSSPAFKRTEEQLSAVLLLLDRSESAAPLDFLKRAETARTLIRTLLTACDAQRAMNARSNRIAGERQRLSALLEALDARCVAMANRVGDEADELSRAARRFLVLSSRRFSYSPSERRIAEPLRSLYSRLKAGMKIYVPTTCGAFSGTLTAAAAESVLKNTDDPVARRSAFGAFNAWYAENAPVFAELLNVVTGVRLNALERLGRTLPEASAADEGITTAVFAALMNVVDAGAGQVRPAVAMQAEVFTAADKAHLSPVKMPVAFLWAPPPFAKVPTMLATFEATIRTMKAALKPIAPDIEDFIDRETADGWVESRNLSGGESGSWTGEVPSFGAVAIFADWQPTVGRAFELAHTLGEAYLRRQLLSVPTLVRRPPIVLCETLGRLFSHALLMHLVRATERDKSDCAAILWQALKRLVKNLLDLPFRARLTQAIHEERAKTYLTVPILNELTQTAWQSYYGESTDGFDQFVWAHKVHFYRTETLHYDWQYAFGFLASIPLYEQMTRRGSTACGGTLADFCRDGAWLDAAALFQKHLHADVSDERFWRQAHEDALIPLKLARAL